jgi:transposase
MEFCIQIHIDLKQDLIIKELLRRIDRLEAEVKELRKENSYLRSEMEKYKHTKNSSNSHMPPSKDENRPQRNQSLREKSDKTVGGQTGHEGKTLMMTENPDEILKEIPDYCSQCGKDLIEVEGVFVERKQVLDIPPIKPVYKEYQVYSKMCCCGHTTVSKFPHGVIAPIQYGANTEALVSYLHSRHYLPFRRMEEFMNDVFRLPISEGGLHCLLNRFTEKARFLYEEIKNRIEKSESIGTDETGAKVNGKKHWYWTWQSENLTYIHHSFNRGIKTIQDVFENGLPNSILQHDRWTSHFHCQAKGHQLCLSHLLRDLNYIEELYNNEWAGNLKKVLKQALELKKLLLSNQYSQPFEPKIKIEDDLDKLLNQPIDISCKKIITLQKYLNKHRSNILLFLYHPKVPPDNNGSERAIRNVKVKQKISGQFKSDKGAEIYAINRSVIDTIIKSKQNVLQGLNLIADFNSD